MSGNAGGDADPTVEQSTAARSTEQPPGAEEPHDSLLAALRVRSHARVGLAVGIGLATVLYLPRVPGLEVSIAGPAGYFLGLAFVLAATTAAVVTAALSIKTFLEPVLDRAAWLRRGGTAAVLGGVGWACTPLLAALADAGTIEGGLWRTLTSLSTIALLVGTIGIHAWAKPGAVALGGTLRRVERAAYWLVLVGLVVAAANATGDAAPVATTGGGSALATPFLVGALLASVGAIPLAAAGELSGRLPRWRIRALQVGALAGAIGIAWLVVLGGWDWLIATDAGLAVPAALAVSVAPAGLGWAVAGQGLWAVARRQGSSVHPPGSPPESTGELGNE